MNTTPIIVVTEAFEKFRQERLDVYTRYFQAEKHGGGSEHLEAITDLYDSVWYGLLGQVDDGGVKNAQREVESAD